MKDKVLSDKGSKQAEEAARSAAFWDGFNAIFPYVPDNTTAYEWLKDAICGYSEQLEKGGITVGKFAFLKGVAYILDFDMGYSYLDNEPMREFDGTKWIENKGPWIVPDEIPESRFKGEIRKIILRYLTACAKLARSVASDTYGFWRELIVRVKFERTLGDGEAIAAEVERKLRLLWVDQSVAR